MNQIPDGFPVHHTYTADDGEQYAIVHLNTPGFLSLNVKLIEAAKSELRLKAALAAAEIDELSACDKLAYFLLTESF